MNVLHYPQRLKSYPLDADLGNFIIIGGRECKSQIIASSNNN